jgi:hypothetical protein
LAEQIAAPDGKGGQEGAEQDIDEVEPGDLGGVEVQGDLVLGVG